MNIRDITNPIDKLRVLVNEYGCASVERHKIIQEFARRLSKYFNDYLDPSPSDRGRIVFPVKPSGEWKVNTDYRGAAFSSYEKGLIDLEPLDYGMAVRIDNLNDNGALWIRITLSFRRVGGKIETTLPSGSSITLDQDSDLRALAELIEIEIKRIFEPELYEDREGVYGKGRIGFLAVDPK